MRENALLVVVVIVTGCANDLHPYVARFDGAPIDPVKLEQATVECTSKAKVAEASVLNGSGAQMTAGVSRMVEQSATNNAAFQGCMAEKGMRVTYGPVRVTTGSIAQQK